MGNVEVEDALRIVKIFFNMIFKDLIGVSLHWFSKNWIGQDLCHSCLAFG